MEGAHIKVASGVKVLKGAVRIALIDSNKYRYTYLTQTSLIAQFEWVGRGVGRGEGAAN